jgi:hypothetical protein
MNRETDEHGNAPGETLGVEECGKLALLLDRYLLYSITCSNIVLHN